MKLVKLAAEFRDTADFVRRNAAAEQAALAWERAADRLEATLRAEGLEELSLAAAEAESGYSRSHLKRLIREGTILNAAPEGEPPRILRAHLPRKPGFGVARRIVPGPSCRTQAARAVAKRED